MSVSTPQVTQRDVAHHCGVHASTICLALKNSPSIPLETRRRIQAAAEELGYQPNAAARNLALLRTEKKAGGSLPIAWVNQESRRDHWRVDPEAVAYFNGARRQAESSGYHLEEVWTREPGMSVPRLIQILRARGISSVLFPVHRRFDFSLLSSAWSEFSMVGLNDHRLGEWLDVVCPDYYQNAETAFRHLRRQNISRMGLVLSAQFDAATQGLVHSCFLRHQSDAPLTERVPVCFLSADSEDRDAEYAEWLRDYRPEAVVVCESARSGFFREQPESDALVVHLQAPTEEGSAGVDARAAEIGALSVECVIEKMRRFDKGVKESTRMHLVRGVWNERRAAECLPETVVA